MLTKDQRNYIRMLENVMPERDIVVDLKDDDDLLRYYLRRSQRGYAHTMQVISWIGKSMDFWLSVGDSHISMEAVVVNFHVLMNQETIVKYKDKLPWFVWSTISPQVGLSQWFLEECSDRLDWNMLDISHTSLTEDFMRKHESSLNWNDIARSQCMSDEFIEEFESRLDLNLLFENPCIPSWRVNSLVFRHGGDFGKKACNNLSD